MNHNTAPSEIDGAVVFCGSRVISITELITSFLPDQHQQPFSPTCFCQALFF
jgi:hypothetical protein